MNFAQRALILGLAAVIPTALTVAYDMSARAETDLVDQRSSKHPNQSSVGRPQVCGLSATTFGGDSDWNCLVDENNFPLVVPWYSIVEAQGAAAGRWCISMAIDGADIAIDQATGVVTDTAAGHADGKAICKRTSATSHHTLVLDPYQFVQSGAVLRRDGVCVTDYDGGINSHTGAPCGDSNECGATDGGGAYCVGGGADGGINPASNQIATARVRGAYVCWTSGALEDVCLE